MRKPIQHVIIKENMATDETWEERWKKVAARLQRPTFEQDRKQDTKIVKMLQVPRSVLRSRRTHNKLAEGNHLNCGHQKGISSKFWLEGLHAPLHLSFVGDDLPFMDSRIITRNVAGTFPNITLHKDEGIHT